MSKSIKLNDNTYIDGVGVWDNITKKNFRDLVSLSRLVGFFTPSQMNFSNGSPAAYGRCIIPIMYQYNYFNRISDADDYYMLFISSGKRLFVGYSSANARAGGNWDISWQEFSQA